jgi:hypothetical protein
MSRFHDELQVRLKRGDDLEGIREWYLETLQFSGIEPYQLSALEQWFMTDLIQDYRAQRQPPLRLN